MAYKFILRVSGFYVRWAAEDGIDAFDARVRAGAHPGISDTSQMAHIECVLTLDEARSLERLGKLSSTLRAEWGTEIHPAVGTEWYVLTLRPRSSCVYLAPEFPGLEFCADSGPIVGDTPEFVRGLISREGEALVAQINGT